MRDAGNFSSWMVNSSYLRGVSNESQQFPGHIRLISTDKPRDLITASPSRTWTRNPLVILETSGRRFASRLKFPADTEATHGLRGCKLREWFLVLRNRGSLSAISKGMSGGGQLADNSIEKEIGWMELGMLSLNVPRPVKSLVLTS